MGFISNLGLLHRLAFTFNSAFLEQLQESGQAENKSQIRKVKQNVDQQNTDPISVTQKNRPNSHIFS